MTPAQAATLRFFKWREFKRPNLVDFEAARFLDAVRYSYGAPLLLTSDARTAAENARIPGHSVTSLHLLGRAFDLRWTFDEYSLWRFVQAVFAHSEGLAVELELVRGPTDRHAHLGLFPDPATPSSFVLALD